MAPRRAFVTNDSDPYSSAAAAARRACLIRSCSSAPNLVGAMSTSILFNDPVNLNRDAY
jgi:hypothetical protein